MYQKWGRRCSIVIITFLYVYAAVVLQGVESILLPVLLGMNSKLIGQEDHGM